MKNTIKLIGVIALVAVIGFSMIACKEDGGNNSLEGSEWTYGSNIIRLQDGSHFSYYDGSEWNITGTYYLNNDDNITFAPSIIDSNSSSSGTISGRNIGAVISIGSYTFERTK